MSNMVKEEKGITIIALVITIIVLLILTGVSIGEISKRKSSVNEAKDQIAFSELTKIQQAIDNLQKDYTILIIAHRLSTIKNANRILVLDDGHIVAEGTHKQLMRNCKEYINLYNTEIRKKD